MKECYSLIPGKLTHREFKGFYSIRNDINQRLDIIGFMPSMSKYIQKKFNNQNLKIPEIFSSTLHFRGVIFSKSKQFLHRYTSFEKCVFLFRAALCDVVLYKCSHSFMQFVLI